MIIKDITRDRKGSKYGTERRSSLGGLIRYVCNDQGKSDRIDNIRCTNLHNDDPDLAYYEMKNVIRMNHRAKVNCKHLVVSFAPNEKPTQDQLKIIEERIAKSYGLENHQRISVCHNDTDSYHMHIVINMIKPKTFKKCGDKWHNFYDLQKLAENIEEQFNFQRTNHTSQKTSAQSKVDDIESRSGIGTFCSYVKERKDIIKNAESWQELHQKLAEEGIAIKLHGNGLIFQSLGKEQYSVKASTVDRSFSKANLEKRLGKFQAPDGEIKTEKQKVYNQRPKVDTPEAKKLYQEYMKDVHLRLTRQPRIDLAGELEKKQNVQLGSSMSSLYPLIKHENQGVKDLIYLLDQLNRAMERRRLEKKKKQIKKLQNQSFKDYVTAKAMTGDEMSVTVLQQLSNKNLQRYGLDATEDNIKDIASDGRVESVTKNGTKIISTEDCIYKINGNRIVGVEENARDETNDRKTLREKYRAYLDKLRASKFASVAKNLSEAIRTRTSMLSDLCRGHVAMPSADEQSATRADVLLHDTAPNNVQKQSDKSRRKHHR